MRADYHHLFRLQLLHEYFRDLRPPHLAVAPSDDCLQLLKGAHMLWQKGDSSYLALIQENGLGEPFTNTIADDGSSEKSYRTAYGKNIFRFYIKHTNHAFANYTSLDLGVSRNQLFYFSNLAANKRNNFLFLSRKTEDHAAGRNYDPGDLVMAPGSDNVFECIRKHTSTAGSLSNNTFWAARGLRFLRKPPKVFTSGTLYLPGDLVLQPVSGTGTPLNVFESLTRHVGGAASELGNTSLWMARGQGQVQYAGAPDQIACTAGSYQVQLPAPVQQATVTVHAFNFNAAAPAYDVPVASFVQELPAASSIVTIQLGTLKPGKYRIQVNSSSVFVYYDPRLLQPGIIGVVEIFNHLPAANAYAFLDAAEKFRNPNYVIFFPARRVLWKYIPKDSRAQSVIDSGTTGFSFTMQGDGFVSNVPILLSEEILSTLELRFSGDDFKMQSLPNPVVSRLGKCTQNGFDYLCSEMYLNY
jgi:hypothetical protein